MALGRGIAGRGAIGIGSPRASLEANFALRRLVGAGASSPGVTDAEAALVARCAAILRRGARADRRVSKPSRPPTPRWCWART
jgi:NADH-quinone oxidoreductase subunit G